MQVYSSTDSVYLNAKADECSSVNSGRVERVVLYRGGVYTVIGYYFASGMTKERTLFCILRAPWRIDRLEVVS